MPNLKIDIQPAQVDAGSQTAPTDPAEIAAAMACVFAVLKSRGLVQSEPETQRESNWGFASKLEAIGEAEVKESPVRTASNRTRSNWWTARSALLSAITVLSGVFFYLA